MVICNFEITNQITNCWLELVPVGRWLGVPRDFEIGNLDFAIGNLTNYQSQNPWLGSGWGLAGVGLWPGLWLGSGRDLAGIWLGLGCGWALAGLYYLFISFIH